MLQPNYPTTGLERWAFRRLEARTISTATHVVVTTDGCRDFYLSRYPQLSENRISVISNGYDPATFGDFVEDDKPASDSKLIILHSGVLYPEGRDPTGFFHAIRRLSDDGVFADLDIEFRFRAAGNDEEYGKTVRDLGLDRYVSFLPRIPYSAAISEMQAADALMILQGSTCNNQIPAKLYEYFFCGKPILGLTDPAGDTGQLLENVGIQSIASLEDREQIAGTIKEFVRKLRSDDIAGIPKETACKFSRRELTGDLGKLLDRTLEATPSNHG